MVWSILATGPIILIFKVSISSRSDEFVGLFGLFDQDGDGKISADEVEHVLANMAGMIATGDRLMPARDL